MRGRRPPFTGRWWLWILILLCTSCTEPSPTLRIGTIPWPGYEYLYLAGELGYFAAEGVAVQLVDFVSLSDSRRAFERGQLDAWATTAVELLQSREVSPRKAQAFFILDISYGADIVLVRAPLQTVGELAGKRVAAEPGTLDVVMLYFALQAAGLDFDDITLVPLPQYLLPKSIARNEVDAAVTYPPNSIALLRSGNYHPVFDSSQIPGVIVDVLAADARLLTSRRRDFVAVVRAVDKAAAYAKAHSAEALAIMARHEGVDAQAMAAALGGISTLPLGEQPAYFEPGGKMEQAFRAVAEALRATHMLQAQQEISTAYTPQIVGETANR